MLAGRGWEGGAAACVLADCSKGAPQLRYHTVGKLAEPVEWRAADLWQGRPEEGAGEEEAVVSLHSLDLASLNWRPGSNQTEWLCGSQMAGLGMSDGVELPPLALRFTLHTVAVDRVLLQCGAAPLDKVCCEYLL